jgi:sodium pump decarboxylase gamma subunit
MIEYNFALEISIIGISAVFATLAVLIAVVYAARAIFSRMEKRKGTEGEENADGKQSLRQDTRAESDMIPAVISAAVSAYLEGTTQKVQRVSRWAKAGREELMETPKSKHERV